MVVGKLHLKNRFVMPPMITHYATPQGYMSDRQIAYYATRAKGGVGLIIVEGTAVSPEGKGSPLWACLHDDSFIPALRRLTEIAHGHGAKILIQLAHAGRQTSASFTGIQPVAPSSTSCPFSGEVPRILTIEEIQGLIKKFAQAASRALRGGFDGVEIHGANGYLIHQFLSPRTNLRSDSYGGDRIGRMNFLIEVLENIKKEVPAPFLIGCRLNGEDFVEGGLQIEETVKISRELNLRGISYLHISCGVAESFHMTIPPMDVEPGFLVPKAEAIKDAVSIPVIAVGRINDPFQADAVIGQGKADLVSMGRALWADPHLPRKALEERWDEICPCIGCNQGCRRKLDRCCLMNPETGREQEFPILPAERPKRIIIVGGGPAGMEAARVAKRRGHQVILMEKSSQLGGNFRLAALPPKREGIKKGLQFFEREMQRLGVQLKLGKEATLESIEEYHAEEVVITTGSIPIIPPISGIKQNNVISAEDVLLQRKAVGNRVLVIGGGLVGCEVADLLSGEGKAVTLVEMLADIVPHVDFPSSFFLRERLQKQRVEIWTSWKVIKIFENIVTLVKAGEEKTLSPVDTVVFAVGYKSSSELIEKMKVSSLKIRVAGDASKPRDALEAILEGAKVAREI
jgi:2,4-dienoyl-CoA reductase-like NADH-dependent reductase (Old Yellow Enzyme family)/thioredoxin reductase